MVSHCLIASLSRRHELRSKRFSANLSGLICVGYPRCVHTDPPVASTGWTEKEAIAAGHNIEVLEETIRLVTDDDRSVVDPEPIKIKLSSSRKPLAHCPAQAVFCLFNQTTHAMRCVSVWAMRLDELIGGDMEFSQYLLIKLRCAPLECHGCTRVNQE